MWPRCPISSPEKSTPIDGSSRSRARATSAGPRASSAMLAASSVTAPAKPSIANRSPLYGGTPQALWPWRIASTTPPISRQSEVEWGSARPSSSAARRQIAVRLRSA